MRLQGFNTQPPEGGWERRRNGFAAVGRFNTQPPEGGWNALYRYGLLIAAVSTHGRLKAAGTA